MGWGGGGIGGGEALLLEGRYWGEADNGGALWWGILYLPFHRTEGALDKNCHEELLEFVEVVDPINDYQLNYALMQNCGDYISEHCKIEQGKGLMSYAFILGAANYRASIKCHTHLGNARKLIF